MQTKVWIYFSKTGTGYEAKGEDIISAFDAFVQMTGTYLIELSFSPLKNVDLPESVKNYINKLYLADELELEANANS